MYKLSAPIPSTRLDPSFNLLLVVRQIPLWNRLPSAATLGKLIFTVTFLKKMLRKL